VTPAADPGRANLEAIKDGVSRVLVPVDFTAATALQLRIAEGLAAAFGAAIVLAHVLEPLPDDSAQHRLLAQFDAKRRMGADCALADLRGELPRTVRADVVVACGDPASEIARIAQERNVGIVVMGLHAAPGRGPRMGSVTYGVLCNAPPLVIALPPAFEDHVWRRSASAQTAGTF
jgi:nucleotide-binding universal stress UspA family protein